VTLSSAIHYGSEKLREKVFAIAANMLECSAGDLELRNGCVGIVGVPGAEVKLGSVAKAARPTAVRKACRRGSRRHITMNRRR
jgi:hypothetical protein